MQTYSWEYVKLVSSEMLQEACVWSLMSPRPSKMIHRCWKTATMPQRGLRCLFTHIPLNTFSTFSLTCQEEKHIMRCCCPCGYELSMWRGCVRVCVYVCPVPLRNVPSPPGWVELHRNQSQYRRAAILTGPQLRADTCISRLLHFTLLTRLSCAGATEAERKLHAAKLRADTSLKVHMCCCTAVPKFEKHIFSCKRSNETVNLPRATVKQDNRAVIKIYG